MSDSITFSTILADLGGFLSFLSTTYGTGDAGKDLTLVGGTLAVALLAMQILQLAGLGRDAGQREQELLGSISGLLNEMSLQVSELKTSVVHELERSRAEIGYLRQELEELKEAWRTPRPVAQVSRRTTDLRLEDLLGFADNAEKTPFR